MYDRYRSRSRDRDGGSYRRRSPRRREDRDGEHYRSRKEDSSRSPPRSPSPRSEEDMYRGRSRYSRGRDNGRHRGSAYGNGRRSQESHGQNSEGLWYDDVAEPSQTFNDAAGLDRGYNNRDYRDRYDRSRSGSRVGGRYSGPDARRQRPPSSGVADYNDRGPPHRRDSGSRGPSRGEMYRRGLGDSWDYPRSSRVERPNPTLILENLPNEVSEKDVLLGMDYASGDSRMSTDQIRFVRIRNAKRGGKIAFVEFWHLSDATAFFERFRPTISFPLADTRGIDSESIPVGINYSRPRDDPDRNEPRVDDGSWNCSECGILNYPHRNSCFKCKVERSDDWRMDDDYGGYDGSYDSYPSGGLILTGETDECPQQAPSQIIVIRDLEGSVTEEVLAKGVAKLFLDNEPPPTKETKPNKLKSTAPVNSTFGLGAAPGSLRRVFLIRDRRSNESWRYGFAEFATLEDARGAVAKFRASAKFTIASKPVVVAFIHTGVFVPAFDDPSSQNSEITFAPIYNPNVRVKYWDDRAYPSGLIVSSGPDLPGPNHAETSGDGDKNATSSGSKGGPTSQEPPAKKAKKDKDPLVSRKALAMAPQMQKWAQKAAELHGVPKERKNDDVNDTISEPPASAPKPRYKHLQLEQPEASPDAPNANDPVHPLPTDQYVSYADWDTLECLLCGKFKSDEWLIYHEVHTHGCYKDEEVKEKAAKLLAERGKEPRTIVRRIPRRKADPLPIYTSYADQDKFICYLCRRDLKHVKVLRRHEQESELHKRNLATPGKIDEAIAALAKLGWKPATMYPLGYDGPIRPEQKQGGQYRDRALERRKVYNQPSKPAPLAGKGAAPAEPEEPAAAAPPKPSKGAGLLAKMGWTAGAGLGAQGEGRTEAIATELYAPGVGLGAEGGKLGDASEEAARKTRNNFSDFVEKTRDKARERFEKLG